MPREILKVALISTVYNEGASIDRWVDALRQQTVLPAEFTITDGGSTDDTVLRLQKGFATGGFTEPRIVIQRCNIAEGRNLAIKNTSRDIIISLDGGSLPEPNWLEQIVLPFRDRTDIDMVGGRFNTVMVNEFQRMLERFHSQERTLPNDNCTFSSRNVAFTRKAWAAVGGYPEWLTLTGEDLLFNSNLYYAGFRSCYQPTAVVNWEMRPDLRSYLKMLWNYGFGAAEAGYWPHHMARELATTLFPPLILLSPHPISLARVRYLRNAANIRGWVEGKLRGHKPPSGWKWMNGFWMSPEAIATANQRQVAGSLLSPGLQSESGYAEKEKL